MYELLKKKYGQNFLIDKNILTKISSVIEKKYLKIIEIGPGDGRLTEYIKDYEPTELILIEVDKDLIELLKSKFINFENLKIIHIDVLKYDFVDKVDLIISNLPYNISSQILVKICLMKHLPTRLILMFQKEFAERLLDKKLNSLNSLVRCFYDISACFNVSKNCFRPIPTIESKVLLFKKKENLLLKRVEIENFITFKRKIFSHKRKTLNNVLKNYNFHKSLFNLNERVESLDIQKLLKIFREINL